ncbi:MAG TPA: DUF4397 domain-containing protein [Micromonosporaceae bacterium]
MRPSQLKRMLAVIALSILTTLGVGALSTGPAHAAASQVYVVHGIPGQPVDVYVNGQKTLDNFQPGTVAGPLSLDEGTYDLALTQPGEPVGNAIVTADDVQVPGGQNLSIVAHLTEDGQPTITPYVNDVTPVPAGQARVIVRHDAAAPAVDVRANGAVVFSNLTNPDEAKTNVPAGTITADVTLAGTDNVVIGPQQVDLAEGTVTIVYAIGSAQDGTLSLIAQTLTGTASAPTGVPAGNGGHAADNAGPATWQYVAVGTAALLLIGGTARVLAQRNARG